MRKHRVIGYAAKQFPTKVSLGLFSNRFKHHQQMTWVSMPRHTCVCTCKKVRYLSMS